VKTLPNFTITASGLEMQVQAQLGGTLQFTRIAIGAGQAANSSTATDLADERMTEDIRSFSSSGGGSVHLGVAFTNIGLANGFGISEAGVFARDPGTGVERLYAYTKVVAPATPDWMPSYSARPVEQQVFAVMAIGSASNVTAVIDDTVILATKNDVRFPTNHTDLQTTPTTAAVTIRQKVGASYVDGVKIMGFGGIAIPIAQGSVPTPPAGTAYLYARTNGLPAPSTRLSVCVKLPDGNDAVICTGDPS
jgi:hypothetical protein